MARTTSVALGDHLTHFVEVLVAEGRYSSTDEVVRAGLRLLEDRESKLHRLREALEEGLESGPPAPFDVEAFVRARTAPS